MHAQPPRTLKRLLKQYGQELIDDPRRTEALLRDHCGQHTREIFVLVNAQKQRVPNELLAAPAWMPRQAVYTRLSKTLQSKLALTEDAADWAVASWAAALELDAAPKDEAWSWLPGQRRAPAAAGSRKGRGKKRQNSPSSVQSNKRTVSAAKARAARAEMGWAFPARPLAQIGHFFAQPIWCANLLPWAALVAATIFLFAVIYWTSEARDEWQASNEAAQSGTQIAANASVTSTSGSLNTLATPFNSSVTPLPQLPNAPRFYASQVMPLPTWARVAVPEAPLMIREGPSTEMPHLGVLQDATPVNVIAFSEDGRWSQINSPRGGWVSNDFLLFTSEDVSHSSVRVRVEPRRTRYETRVLVAPRADAAEVTTLNRDALVIVGATLGNPVEWVQIADPTVGWVAANDLVELVP